MDAARTKDRFDKTVRRRDLFRAVMTGAAAAAVNTVAVEAGEPRSSDDKRRARYRANSAEVQDFYRVNRYPTH